MNRLEYACNGLELSGIGWNGLECAGMDLNVLEWARIKWGGLFKVLTVSCVLCLVIINKNIEEKKRNYIASKRNSFARGGGVSITAQNHG